MTLKEKLINWRIKNDLVNKIMCSSSEEDKYLDLLNQGKPLPKGIYSKEYSDEVVFFSILESDDITSEEMIELISHIQLAYTKTIKNCLKFFVILTSISLGLALISILLLLTQFI